MFINVSVPDQQSRINHYTKHCSTPSTKHEYTAHRHLTAHPDSFSKASSHIPWTLKGDSDIKSIQCLQSELKQHRNTITVLNGLCKTSTLLYLSRERHDENMRKVVHHKDSVLELNSSYGATSLLADIKT